MSDLAASLQAAAEAVRQGEWVEPTAVISVDEVNPDRRVAYPGLTRSGARDGQPLKPHDLGTAGLPKLDREGRVRS